VTVWQREFFIDLDADARIAFRRSARPPIQYAITLEIEISAQWQVIRLWDNAHAPSEHHEHEYTRNVGKLSPPKRTFGSVNEAMDSAVRTAREHWREIRAQWIGDD
jgi:hypothetical protein